ncbi:hypothetical protein [Frigoriglobus tundricola]|uniref:Uncharacterized protein n=1 Tax=Frigoriglobus tundricola TaxID=2774151 RepID=A0A6M5YPB5_9BACT|nr:hypothetical protein [Frigoriglobus tundricola]QJW95186.1 hypothetical protein FTUN_2725 [Frigoriglobus tundricola]
MPTDEHDDDPEPATLMFPSGNLKRPVPQENPFRLGVAPATGADLNAAKWRRAG